MIKLKDFSPDNIPTQKQVEYLGQFLIENFGDEICKNGKFNGEGAIEMAVRLLIELKEMRLYYEDGKNEGRKEVLLKYGEAFDDMFDNPLDKVNKIKL